MVLCKKMMITLHVGCARINWHISKAMRNIQHRRVDIDLQGDQAAGASAANISHSVWQLMLAADTMILFSLKK